MQLKHTRSIAVVLFLVLPGVLLYLYLNRPKLIAVVVKRVDMGIVQNTVANTRAVRSSFHNSSSNCPALTLSPSLTPRLAI